MHEYRWKFKKIILQNGGRVNKISKLDGWVVESDNRRLKGIYFQYRSLNLYYIIKDN